jgi:hypothetical protein
MTRILLIGIGAGAAAALLFASMMSGVLLSAILFYLAPLPIMIAALGWSPWAGLIAVMAAAAMLGGALGMPFPAIFLTLVGAPAWWLSYLAMLGRPIANGAAAQMEWYPPGRLVLWAVILGAAVTGAALATIGFDEAAIGRSLRDTVEAVLCPAPDVQVPDAPAVPSQINSCPSDIEPVVETVVRLLPPAAAVLATLTQIANLWLAGLAVKLSGRLRRPWPDLTALTFPPVTALVYGACLAGALLPGLPGLFARLFAAPLTVGFAMVGFAVLHAAARGMRGRAPLLWAVYGSALFLLFFPVALVMAIIGVAETLFGLRDRLSKRDPPAARSP